MAGFIDRGIIIRRDQVKMSIDFAKNCADSCEEYNLPYEYIKAVEFLPCDEAFKSVGAFKLKSYKNTMGNCCCHSSMIKCWRRIIELDKPCIIFEHDAIVRGEVRTIEIPDMAVVTFGFRVRQKDEYTPIGPPEKLLKLNRSVGCHAYALTPETAKWLVDDVETNGVSVGVDRWLMMQTASGLPLYACEPPQAVCWARGSTSNLTKEQKDQEWKGNVNSATKNYDLTPMWKKGLK